MDSPAPQAFLQMTTMRAVSQMIDMAVYLAIGLAALAQAPRDPRTQVFAGIAAVFSTAAGVQVACWFLGITSDTAYQRAPLGIVFAAFTVLALLLFHFSQVFPIQRPWVRQAGIQLPIAYVLAPIAVFLMVRWAPAKPEEITARFAALFLVFGFPLVVLAGIVLPVATVVSFLRTLRELPITKGLPDARRPLAAIILSQVGGLLVAILIVGPVAVAAPDSWALKVVSTLQWLVSLLTPLAFGAAVWHYRVLEIPPDGSAVVKAE